MTYDRAAAFPRQQNTHIAADADSLQGALFRATQLLDDYSHNPDAASLSKRCWEASRKLESIWRRRDSLAASSPSSEFAERSDEASTIGDARTLRDESIDLITRLQAEAAGFESPEAALTKVED